MASVPVPLLIQRIGVDAARELLIEAGADMAEYNRAVRDMRVLTLRAQGSTFRAIAARLHISKTRAQEIFAANQN